MTDKPHPLAGTANDYDVGEKTPAQEALERALKSYKILLSNTELCEPKNADGSKTFAPWLRDCRTDLEEFETITTALEAQAEKDRVMKLMAEALKQVGFRFERNHIKRMNTTQRMAVHMCEKALAEFAKMEGE